MKISTTVILALLATTATAMKLNPNIVEKVLVKSDGSFESEEFNQIWKIIDQDQTLKAKGKLTQWLKKELKDGDKKLNFKKLWDEMDHIYVDIVGKPMPDKWKKKLQIKFKKADQDGNGVLNGSVEIHRLMIVMDLPDDEVIVAKKEKKAAEAAATEEEKAEDDEIKEEAAAQEKAEAEEDEADEEIEANEAAAEAEAAAAEAESKSIVDPYGNQSKSEDKDENIAQEAADAKQEDADTKQLEADEEAEQSVDEEADEDAEEAAYDKAQLEADEAADEDEAVQIDVYEDVDEDV